MHIVPVYRDNNRTSIAPSDSSKCVGVYTSGKIVTLFHN